MSLVHPTQNNLSIEDIILKIFFQIDVICHELPYIIKIEYVLNIIKRLVHNTRTIEYFVILTGRNIIRKFTTLF